MISKSCLVLLAYCSCVLLIQKSTSVRVTPNVDDFMVENQRTQARQNYLVQRAFDGELSAANMDNIATLPEAINAEASPGELSSQIVDCANLIRNDIIYSDNSAETTTRKRGNIRKKNFAMAAPPCSCASEREELFLGENFFPIRLDSRKCAETCSGTYHCKSINYWVTVLKRQLPLQSRERLIHPMTYQSALDMPQDLRRWEAHRVNVTTSCVCTADEIEININ